MREALEHAAEADALPGAEDYAEFGRRIGKEARTVRAWIASGRLPSRVLVGTGRGRRVLVREALAGLQSVPAGSSGEVEGADYVARRRLRLVGGES